LIGDFTGKPNLRAAFIKNVPVFTRVLLFIAANNRCIFFNSRSDLDSNAVAVSSKEIAVLNVLSIN
jgi:hypothetical protein